MPQMIWIRIKSISDLTKNYGKDWLVTSCKAHGRPHLDKTKLDFATEIVRGCKKGSLSICFSHHCKIRIDPHTSLGLWTIRLCGVMQAITHEVRYSLDAMWECGLLCNTRNLHLANSFNGSLIISKKQPEDIRLAVIPTRRRMIVILTRRRIIFQLMNIRRCWLPLLLIVTKGWRLVNGEV